MHTLVTRTLARPVRIIREGVIILGVPHIEHGVEKTGKLRPTASNSQIASPLSEVH